MVSKALVSAAYRKRVEEIAALGVDITLVVPPRWGEWPLEPSKPIGYRQTVLKTCFNGRNHFHFYRGLRDIFTAEKPDIAHIDEEPYSVVTWQALREARRVGARPIFYTWQNIHKRFPPPFNWIEGEALRNSVAALAGNQEAAQVLRRKGFNRSVHIVPQVGVDPEVYRPVDAFELRREISLKDQFVIGYVGRLIPEKGIATLMDAVEKLRRTGQNIVVLVRGAGRMRTWMERRAAASSLLRGRLRWLPPVASNDLAATFSAMDCLVLPSLTRSNWKEQFGRVLVEAMACEVPVIGSDSGEIPNVIGDAGLTFPEGDAAALADRVRQLISAPDVRRQLARSGRERVMDRFTHRRVAKETVAAYEDALCA